MKKHLLYCVVTLLFVPQIIMAAGETFEYKGLNYIVNADDATVSVGDNRGCSGDIVIPGTVEFNSQTYSVTAIHSNAFYLNGLMTSIEIPTSVTIIENQAFFGCTGLRSIELPSSVTSIGGYVFGRCTELMSITVSKDNRVYDSRDNCNAIIETATNMLVYGCRNTKIPDSVTSIGPSAFHECIGLTSIDIPSSVTTIRSGAFSRCTGLTSIEIPNSIVLIDYKTFYDCSGLTSISVDKNNRVYDSRDNCNAIIETATNTLVFGCENTKIPSNITSIGDDAFSGRTGLISIEIPSGVTSIGDEAFAGCTGLTSIEIPNSVQLIRHGAFSGCSGLLYVIIPNSVSSIGDHAFHGCTGLASVEILGNVTSIGYDAFFGCTGLMSVTSMIENPSEENEVFDEYFIRDHSILRVPCKVLDVYKRTAMWNKFYSIECIEAKHIDEPLDDVVITPSSTNVVIAWPVVDNADSYVIEIKSGSKTGCVLIFNGEGQLLSVEYPSASERMAEARDASAAYGYQYSIASLTPGTEYSYTIEALDDSERILSIKSGSFITNDEPVSADAQSAEPEFKNKVYVQDKNIIVEGLSAEEYSIYNTAGKQVGNPVPASGVYVVKVGDEAVKVMVK